MGTKFHLLTLSAKCQALLLFLWTHHWGITCSIRTEVRVEWVLTRVQGLIPLSLAACLLMVVDDSDGVSVVGPERGLLWVSFEINIPIDMQCLYKKPPLLLSSDWDWSEIPFQYLYQAQILLPNIYILLEVWYAQWNYCIFWIFKFLYSNPLIQIVLFHTVHSNCLISHTDSVCVYCVEDGGK